MSSISNDQHISRTIKWAGTWAILILLSTGSVAVSGENERRILPQIPLSSSTVPSNGDLNPYGVAFVPAGFAKGGSLSPGDLLVSNFNNQQNQQGTGTTIVRVSPNGQTSLFFQGNPGLGLTTALGALLRGFVLVGNVPTVDGSCSTVQPGSILVLNSVGAQVGTLSDPALLDGPWDLTIVDNVDHAQVFVSNVLNGTVTRLNLSIGSKGVTLQSATQIASGYVHRCDPAALVVGPTGLAYDSRLGVLYVASTGDNEIFAVAGAATIGHTDGKGRLVYQDARHLHGPLALVLAPNGHLITSNGDAVNPDPNQPSEIVEFTAGGKFIAQAPIDPNPGGAFGLGLAVVGDDVFRFAAVDDNANNVSVWTIPLEKESP